MHLRLGAAAAYHRTCAPQLRACQTPRALTRPPAAAAPCCPASCRQLWRRSTRWLRLRCILRFPAFRPCRLSDHRWGGMGLGDCKSMCLFERKICSVKTLSRNNNDVGLLFIRRLEASPVPAFRKLRHLPLDSAQDGKLNIVHRAFLLIGLPLERELLVSPRPVPQALVHRPSTSSPHPRYNGRRVGRGNGSRFVVWILSSRVHHRARLTKGCNWRFRPLLTPRHTAAASVRLPSHLRITRPSASRSSAA